jgi:hypothetical protein
MDAKDLRIGNWIFDASESQENYRVEEIRKDSEGFEGYYIVYRNGSFKSVLDDELSSIEPIPLTKEWLLKFGLLNLNDIETLGGSVFIDIKNKSFGIGGSDSVTNGMIYYAECEHVHQLQNLYFALTGEELKIVEDEK